MRLSPSKRILWIREASRLAEYILRYVFFFFSSRRRHTRLQGDWSSDVCSSDLDSLGDVCECAVAVVLIKAIARTFGSVRQANSGEDKNVEPAIVVVVQKCTAEIGRASCRERV